MIPELEIFLKKSTTSIVGRLRTKSDIPGFVITADNPPRAYSGIISPGTNEFIPTEDSPIRRFKYSPGKRDPESGMIVLPMYYLEEVIRTIESALTIKKVKPSETTPPIFIGDNLGVIVMPMTKNSDIVAPITSAIVSFMSKGLRLSLLVSEVEAHSSEQTSLLTGINAGYQYAMECLNRTGMGDFRKIIVSPTRKLTEILLSSSSTSSPMMIADIVKSLQKAVVEGEPQKYWLVSDTKTPVNTAISNSGFRYSPINFSVIAESKPIETSLEGAETTDSTPTIRIMIIRSRIIKSISYPDPAEVGIGTGELIADPDEVRRFITERGEKFSTKAISNFIRNLPTDMGCTTELHVKSMSSRLFMNVFRLVSTEATKGFKEAIELYNDMIEAVDIQICGAKPLSPPVSEADKYPAPTIDSPDFYESLKPDILVGYNGKVYFVVDIDKSVDLAIVLPYQATTIVSEREIVPLSFLRVFTKKIVLPKVIVPGVGSTEYLSVCKLIDKDGKKTLEHITILERCVFGEPPVWRSGNKNTILKFKDGKWTMTHSKVDHYLPDEGDTRSLSWRSGWCGVYSLPGGDETFLVSERFGNPADAARMFIHELPPELFASSSLLFSGKPEVSSKTLTTQFSIERYLALREAIIVKCAVPKVTMSVILSLGVRDPQISNATFLQGATMARLLMDDVGITSLTNKWLTRPGIRFQSLTSTPYYKTSDDRDTHNRHLTTITNPESDMKQFITFYSDENQVASYILPIWSNAGPPLYRPPKKLSGAEKFVSIAKSMLSNAAIDMYKDISYEHVIWAIQYAFHRLRAGTFVSIRNNAIQLFAPFVKLAYINPYERSDEFWFGEDVSEKQYLAKKNAVLRELGLKPESFIPREQWFANGSLVGNMRSTGMNDIFNLIVLHMLRETLAEHYVGDCDFILNVRDFPKLRKDGRDPDHAIYGKMATEETPPMRGYDMPGGKTIPFLGFNAHPSYADIPIVDPDTWSSTVGGYFGLKDGGSEQGMEPAESSITPEEWQLRAPRAVFRGSATGYGSGSDSNQRLLLAEMFPGNERNPHADVAITSGAVRDRKTSAEGMRYLIPGSVARKLKISPTTKAEIQSDKKMPVRSPPSSPRTGQDKYRMVIYVDGNAGAYRYSSLMASGFTILRIASLVGYEMWMYPGLKNALPGSDGDDFRALTNEEITALFVSSGRDGDHILVDKNLKNLQRIIEWAQSGDDATEITRQIAENAIKKYKAYCSKKSLMNLMAITLNAVSSQQKWTMRYSARRSDVSEPRLAEDITRVLGMVDKKTRVQREILEKLREEMSTDAKIDETIRFKRPPLVPGDDRKLYVDVDTIKEVSKKIVGTVPPAKLVPDARRPISDMELEDKLTPSPIKTDVERLKTNLGLRKGRHGGLSYLIQKARTAAAGVEEDLTLSI
jgi:hypothetical protein